MAHRFQVKLLHSTLTQYLKWTLPTNSPWSFSNHSNQNAKQTEGGFANSNCPISSCQLSVFSPRASPDCTSHRWSAFSPTFHSSKVAFTTDPTDFWEWQIWVVAFSSRFTIWQSLNSITSHLLQKISHMIFQGFGPIVFLKMLQTKRLQSTVVDSGSAIPKRLLFKRFRLQWKRRDSGTSRVFHYLQKQLALQVHVFW